MKNNEIVLGRLPEKSPDKPNFSIQRIAGEPLNEKQYKQIYLLTYDHGDLLLDDVSIEGFVIPKADTSVYLFLDQRTLRLLGKRIMEIYNKEPKEASQ